MSRMRFENTAYTVYVGVDHVTGAFIQIWANPEDQQDEPIVVYDNRGMSLRSPNLYAAIPEKARYILDAYRDSLKNLGYIANLDVERVCQILKDLGISITEKPRRELYEIFD